MKNRILLTLLLCFALVQSQTYAHFGGPDYGGVGGLSGTYAGVLIPASGTGGVTDVNGLGVFTLGLPIAGLGTGTFLMFANGVVYNVGTITAISDPTSREIQGILQANSPFSTTTSVFDPATFTFTDTTVSVTANGAMKVTVLDDLTLDGKAVLSLVAGTDASGNPNVTATLDFFVTGVLQSTSVATSSTTGKTTGG